MKSSFSSSLSVNDANQSTDSLPGGGADGAGGDRSSYVKKFMRPPPREEKPKEAHDPNKPKIVFPTLKETNILDLANAEEAVYTNKPNKHKSFVISVQTK